MAQRYLILLFALAVSCGSPVFTQEQFAAFSCGTSVEILTENYGQPYDIKIFRDGTAEYHYIQRVPVRPDAADEHHYYFIVKDGKVLSKRHDIRSSNIDVQFRNF